MPRRGAAAGGGALSPEGPSPLAVGFPRFLALGWALVPVLPGGKAPHLALLRELYGDTRVGHLRHAPALAGEVALWLEREPGVNLAVIPGEPGRLVVADVDRLDLLDPGLLDPGLATPTASSGREGGGLHLYFVSGRPVGTALMPWGHVNPAYVLLPGSLHPSGRRYAWLPGRSPDEVPFMAFEEAAGGAGRGAAAVTPGPGGDPRLPAHLARYRDGRPSRARRGAAWGSTGARWSWRSSRSSCAQGLSDDEIGDYFDRHALPRYSEEGTPRRWLASLIRTARDNQDRYRSSRARPGAGDGRRHTDTYVLLGFNTLRPGEAYCVGGAAVPGARGPGRRGSRRATYRCLGEWHREIIEVSGRLADPPGGTVDRPRPRREAARARLRGDGAAARQPSAGAPDREGEGGGEAGAGPLVPLRAGRVRRAAGSDAAARRRTMSPRRASPPPTGPRRGPPAVAARRTRSASAGCGSCASAATSG